MSGYADSEKIQYALKTALYRTMQTAMSDSASVERSAPLRVFPTNIMKVNIIEAGKGDIDENGLYVTGHATAGQTVDLSDPESTVKNYKIICPVNNVITSITISALVGYGSQTKAQIDALPTSGQTYPLKQWFFRGHYSGSGEAAFNAANVTYYGLQLAWNSTTNNTTPSEADTVPHLKYYLQVQTNYTGVSHSSSADNITYEHSLLKGLIGLDSNFVSTIMVTQGEGGPSSSASLGTSGSQAGDFWFTQPTAGILSFYGVTNKVDASTDLATFNTKYPMISYVRYTGETGFGAGTGGGGGAAADPQQALTEEPSWSSDSMTTRFIDGVIIASTEMDSNQYSRPAIATRNSSTSIKDYEISAIPHHYTNFTSNYGWDHGFLRIRAGGGTNANQTSYIDLTGYSGNADMTRNIVFGTSGTERMRINSSGNVGIGTTSTDSKLQVNGNVGCGGWSSDGNTSMFCVGADTNWGMKFIHSGSQYYNRISYYGTGTDDRGIEFYDTNGGTSKTRMFISGSGNVGIGTASPGYKLHIANESLSNSIHDLLCLEAHISSQAASYGPAILFRERWNNGSYFNLARILGLEQSGYGGQLAFYTNEGTGSADNTLLERMRIDENGNVGIGVSNPSERLVVNTEYAQTKLVFGIGGNDYSTVMYIGGAGTQQRKLALISEPEGGWCRSNLHFCLNTAGDYSDATKENDSKMVIKNNGNVGIGTTTPDKYYYNGSATGGSFTSTDKILAIHGGTSNQNNGVARLVLACDSNHTASIFAKHTGSGNTHMGFLTTDGTAAPVERMSIMNSGNVGIGTTSPYAPLYVVGPEQVGDEPIQPYNTSSFNKSVIAGFTTTNPSGAGGNNFGLIFGTLRYNAASYLQSQSTNYAAYYNLLLNPNGGNVGIGITDPASPLEILCTQSSSTAGSTQWNGAKGLRLARWYNHSGQTNSSQYAWEIVNGWHNSLLFRNINSNGTIFKDNVLVLDDNGNVGIGTTDPTYVLDIFCPSSSGWQVERSGKSITSNLGIATGNYTYFLLGGSSVFRSGSGKASSLEGTLSVNGSSVSSDRRIKKNIVDVDAKIALETLKKIPCREYEYRDTIHKFGKTIGFIAQEVREIIPNAVMLEKRFTPNEMRHLTNIKWNEVKDSSDNTHYTLHTDLQDVSGVKYLFYVSNEPDGIGEEAEYVVGNSDNTFTFLEKYSNIFCYGKEVNDFHQLDKQKLFALNFSATQELDRKVIALETKNTELENEVATLKSELAAIKQHLGI